MGAAEIINKVWNYAHVLRALRSLTGFIKYFLNSVLVTLQNPFGFHQVFPELRSGHDGVGYWDYGGQITYLIFLKVADERDKAGQQVQVPNKYAWAKLVKLDGDAKENRFSELQYRHTLENLGKQGGMLGAIFLKAGYIRGVLVHLFGESWRTQCIYEYGYSLEGARL